MKKKIIIIVAIVVVVIGLLLCFLFLAKDEKKTVNNLDVVYYGGSSVKIDSSDLPYEKKITVENTTDDPLTFSLEWNHVKNTFKDQNKLLYTITGDGEYAASLGKSQVPVAGYKVFPSVAVLGHKKQTYIVKITYNGTDKKGTYEGTLLINSEKPKKQKDVKKHERKEKSHHDEKDRKADVKKDEIKKETKA